MDLSSLENMLIEIVEEINQNKDNPALQNPGSDTELYNVVSGNLNLDSLDLFYLLSSMQDNISDETGKSINLLDVSIIHIENSPLQTVGSLAKYASELIDAQ